MANRVGQCILWIHRYLDNHPGRISLETRIDSGAAFGLPLTDTSSGYEPHSACWGTADIVVCGIDEMLVADLKFGKWPVDVLTSTQLALYAIGAMHLYKDLNYDRIRLAVLQPQHGFADFVITVDELFGWRDANKPAMLAAIDPASKRIPSEKACQWCPGRVRCPERAAANHAQVCQEFGVKLTG
jgi:hypothetical protein